MAAALPARVVTLKALEVAGSVHALRDALSFREEDILRWLNGDKQPRADELAAMRAFIRSADPGWDGGNP